MTDYVGYARVSTQRQGASGLGLDAQRAAMDAHVRPGDRLVQVYIEVESGARAARPQLARAQAHAQLIGGTLLVAKLDRLSRNLAFIAALMDGRAPFVAADNPHANRLTLHLLAAVAEHERGMISDRTKAALTAAKARGVKLGGDRGWRPSPADAAKARAVLAETADRTASLLMPALERARAAGCKSMASVAAALERDGVRAPRGGSKWTATTVSRTLARAAAWRTNESPPAVGPGG